MTESPAEDLQALCVELRFLAEDALHTGNPAVANTLLAAEAELRKLGSEVSRHRKSLWSLVRAAKHAGNRRDWCGVPAWGVVCDLTGWGSTSARALCREFGVDPDERTDAIKEPSDA